MKVSLRVAMRKAMKSSLTNTDDGKSFDGKMRWKTNLKRIRKDSRLIGLQEKKAM